MARADSDITARWVAVAAFVDDTRRAECSPAQVAQRLTELCVHTLGFAGATVQLLEPARGTVGLVAPGPGKGALRSRLVAAQALAQEVLRRESSRFIEQPGRPVRVAVAALPARLTMPADRDPSRAAPPHLGRPSADLARGAAGDGRQVAGSGPKAEGPGVHADEGDGEDGGARGVDAEPPDAGFDAGFDATAYALPLRHGPVAVGGLALLCTDPDGLSEDDVRLVHHVAAAAAELLWEGRVEPVQDISVERLRDAIEQRVLVAQATGVIAERFGIGTTSALAMLRTAADSSRRPLRVVAHEVVVRRRTGRLRR